MIVVAAAGNSGLPACDQPSGQGRLLCVGAVDKRRDRSYFSNFGSGLGIVAPGGSGLPFQDEDVLSTWNDGGYMELAGTSQATPHVSGVAALLVSKGLRGQAAVRRILDTATDAGPAGPDPQFGAGIVNASRALQGCPARRWHAPAAAQQRRARVGSPGSRGSGTVLRHGLRVGCLAAGSGRCKVAARRSRISVAAGAAPSAPGRAATVTARVTRKGRKLLRCARSSATSACGSPCAWCCRARACAAASACGPSPAPPAELAQLVDRREATGSTSGRTQAAPKVWDTGPRSGAPLWPNIPPMAGSKGIGRRVVP